VRVIHGRDARATLQTDPVPKKVLTEFLALVYCALTSKTNLYPLSSWMVLSF
jgi:hypothetical protein